MSARLSRKGGHDDLVGGQTMEERRWEVPAVDRCLEVHIGGGHDAHVAGDRVAAHAAHVAGFERAEQRRLQRRRRGADLIEKQRASVRGAEEPIAGGVRSGECAAAMTEQCRRPRGRNQRGHVHAHQRTAAPWAEVMDGLGHELFAGARLTADEHRKIEPRHPHDLLANGGQRVAAPHHPQVVVAAGPARVGREQEHDRIVEHDQRPARDALQAELLRASHDLPVEPHGRRFGVNAQRDGPGGGQLQPVLMMGAHLQRLALPGAVSA